MTSARDPLRRGHLAAPPRTLVDILLDTAESCPDDPALDNGNTILTYSEFVAEANVVAATLADNGIGQGDKVGVRITSGTTDLYVAIIGVLLAGAAYVPVDADDPDERARTVFDEAAVAATLGNDLTLTVRRPGAPIELHDPDPQDDAWVIFTSGSTGKPKGVAVTHRNAAAFVDAESHLFLQERPIAPGDRVMAGLSVAFDASCEEMWLAWRYGGCLVPAPRSLVRSGMDLGPWLVANRITVVSTVPTLVSLWPASALDRVRLLILGGEACPPEIGARLATPQREVWNTYGPTEATVVACAAQLTGQPPVRIGLPLDGWDLAVVDGDGHEVPEGDEGELIIGGVGLARYLDPVKDAEKYAPMPTLGWERAYRSGDVVVRDPQGLLFRGRADDQVKVGGRRIELGEIDSALLQLDGVAGAAAAIRSSASGNKLIVGYLLVTDQFDRDASLARLRADMPAALVPRLAVVDDLPTRTSGKIDRDALPWPLPDDGTDAGLSGTAAWVADIWRDVLGSRPNAGDDFFALGGGSLPAAQIIAQVREQHPQVTVADIYEHTGLQDFADYLDAQSSAPTSRNRATNPVPLKAQLGQIAALLPLRTITGLRWALWAAAASTLGHAAGWELLPTAPWWAIALGWLLLICAPGRMLITAAGARILLAGIRPGVYPRGGKVHLRLWLTERFADEIGATGIAGAVLMKWYARLLGARIGKNVDLHSLPPLTGHLRLGNGCSIEPEVGLTGHWLDGDRVHIGAIEVGKNARVGARSTLTPGAIVGNGAEIAAGSAVFGQVPAGERWSGAPAAPLGPARGPWEGAAPADNKAWLAAYGAMGVLISLLPVIAAACGIATAWPFLHRTDSLGSAAISTLAVSPLIAIVGYAVLVLLVLALVRALGLRLEGGHYPVLSAPSWKVWSTIRVLDEARTWLFPLYAGALTTVWMRLLGAKVGKDAEISTALLVPSLTTIGAGAFLADDTLIGGYELGYGWMRFERVKVGKRAFVGNSGMTAPGRKVPKSGLVAVLSAAPRRGTAKAGSSWIGSPPEQLRRVTQAGTSERTFAPTRRLRVLRGLVETCRILALWATSALALFTVGAVMALAAAYGWIVASIVSGAVLLVVGALAVLLAIGAKWLLVGRWRAGEHPLWSSLIWRGELADSFVETVAVPWLLRAVPGTTVLNAYFTAMGATVGHGVWCDTYWLPEHDLIELDDGATINPGCVIQTHLFHDRVLSLDTVTFRDGATLGPNSVVLPGSTLGRHATIGPGSLVMRGESVPDKTRWSGNPIGPWADDPAAPARRERTQA